MKTLLLVLLVSTAAIRVLAQDLTPAKNAVPSYSLQTDTFIDALVKVASQFELPLAVEWIKSPDTLKPIRFSRSNATAGEVLDAVVSAQGDYTWRLENGVVHIFQKTMLDDPRNPLNVRIDTLPNGSWTVNDADNFMFQSIGQAVRGIGPKVVPVPSGAGEEPHFPLAGKNDSVRELLDKIVRASKMRIWIATFPNDLALTIKGFWEVTPVFDPRYVKPEDQPFWIFLRWGDAPWKRLESPEP
jgi:hypothetical protein